MEFKTLFIIWTAVIMVMPVWLYKAKPPREFMKKYSKSKWLGSIIPFRSGWKKIVEPGSDMDALQRFRKVAIAYFMIVVLGNFFLLTTGYFEYASSIRTLNEKMHSIR